MPAFSVVDQGYGSTDTSTTDPETWTITMPGGASVGDWMVLSVYGGYGYNTADSRFTDVFTTGTATIAGAFGRITDLSDVTFTTAGSPLMPALAFLTILSSSGILSVVSWDHELFTGSPPTTTVVDTSTPGQSTATDVLVWLTNVSATDVPRTPGTDADYTSLATDGGEDSDANKYALRLWEWHGSAGAPDLTSTDPGTGVTERSRLFLSLTSTPLSTGHTYLRQHQSPVMAPSRVRPIDLRRRQTPRIT